MITSYHKTPIFKSNKYLNYIRSLQCVACDDKIYVVTAHHEAFGTKAMGKNLIPDSQSVPLCVRCHGMRHDIGYQSFWNEVNIDPKLIIINQLSVYLLDIERGR
jgi:hypothetical protein